MDQWSDIRKKQQNVNGTAEPAPGDPFLRVSFEKGFGRVPSQQILICAASILRALGWLEDGRPNQDNREMQSGTPHASFAADDLVSAAGLEPATHALKGSPIQLQTTTCTSSLLHARHNKINDMPTRHRSGCPEGVRNLASRTMSLRFDGWILVRRNHGGDDRSLPALPAAFGQPQSPASQVTVDAERSQDVLRSLPQQRSQIGIAFFADMQLRLAPSRVAPSRLQSQMAAPGETRTPNLHRCEDRSLKSADGRVATVAIGQEKTFVQRKNKRTHLTPTGLLMEGHSTQNPSRGGF